MAIQLNERDQQIFKLIEEHHVLLEKHIAWFISKDSKPVLIRDRLRKLFYLDYLLCSRHAEILPWWTTPTKPLVYTLSSLARQAISANGNNGGSTGIAAGDTGSSFQDAGNAVQYVGNTELDLSESKVQQHFLELANLRMLLLMAQKDGLISSVQWTTLPGSMANRQAAGDKSVDVSIQISINVQTPSVIEAKVSFMAGSEQKSIGIINSPFADSDSLIPQLKDALNGKSVNQLWIICQDNIHKALLQAMVASTKLFGDKILFATHSDLYSLGIVRSKWQTADRQDVVIIDQACIDAAVNVSPANVSPDNVCPLPLGSFPHAATA